MPLSDDLRKRVVPSQRLGRVSGARFGVAKIRCRSRQSERLALGPADLRSDGRKGCRRLAVAIGDRPLRFRRVAARARLPRAADLRRTAAASTQCCEALQERLIRRVGRGRQPSVVTLRTAWALLRPSRASRSKAEDARTLRSSSAHVERVCIEAPRYASEGLAGIRARGDKLTSSPTVTGASHPIWRAKPGDSQRGRRLRIGAPHDPLLISS